MEKKFNEEQIEKLKACKTEEEVKELAEKEGFELSDEEIENVSGGTKWGHTGSRV